MVLSLPRTLLAGERNPEPRQAILGQLKPADSLLHLSALRHMPADFRAIRFVTLASVPSFGRVITAPVGLH